MKCRHCAQPLQLELVDLGSAPPSNAYLTAVALSGPEKTYPLKVMVCERCWLAQTLDFAEADELFSAEYAYFSSFSSTWLAHAERYVGDMVARLGLNAGSHVVEVASNDGYLLQFVKARGITCLGIEPTASTAAAARAKGIETLEEFFGTALGRRLASEGKSADLTAANNVLAHVPDINDFLGGFAALLKPDGVAIINDYPIKSTTIASGAEEYPEGFKARAPEGEAAGVMAVQANRNTILNQRSQRVIVKPPSFMPVPAWAPSPPDHRPARRLPPARPRRRRPWKVHTCCLMCDLFPSLNPGVMNHVP